MGGTPEEEEEVSSPSVPDLPIQKKVLHAGKGNLPKFADGTKVTINFEIRFIAYTFDNVMHAGDLPFRGQAVR